MEQQTRLCRSTRCGWHVSTVLSEPETLLRNLEGSGSNNDQTHQQYFQCKGYTKVSCMQVYYVFQIISDFKRLYKRNGGLRTESLE
jgi:hypothetical protein